MITPRRLPLAAVLCVAALGAGPAAAAPQILGIVASNGAIPLGCDANGCRAEVSAFCLQQTRPVPAADTVYHPAHAADVTLIGTTASGKVVRIPADRYVTMTNSRGFTAVRVSLSLETLAALGFETAAIEIGPHASLLPAAETGESDPLDAEEIALAIGPLRMAAERFFDAGDPRANAMRLTDVMINALPEAGRSTIDREGDASGALLRQARAADPAAAADPKAVALAAGIHAQCRWAIDEGLHFSVRRCLEAGHDRLVLDANVELWEATGGY